MIPHQARRSGARALLTVCLSCLSASGFPPPPVHAQATAETRAQPTSAMLTVSPAHPRRGEPFQVRYRGVLAQDRPSALLLRARFRTLNSTDQPREAPAVRLGVLRRDPDGSYSARLQLPDSVPYAALAVATLDGTRVDDDGERAWPLLTGDAGGQPAYRARVLHANDYLGRNVPRAFREIRAAVASAPDSVFGWYLLDFYGLYSVGPAYLDSVRTEHLAQLASLERRYGASARGLDAYAFLMAARLLKDTSRVRVWNDRFLSEAPTSPFQRGAQVDALVRRLRSDPAAALDSLESFWTTRGAPERDVAFEGVRLALRAKDTVRLTRWDARYTNGSPEHRATVAGMLAGQAAFRAMGVARLDSLRRLPVERLISEPRLDETRAQYQQRAHQSARDLAATLADARLALGDSGVALALMDSVAQASSDTALFARVAQLAYARGDTARAVRWLARRAAMPLASDTTAPAHATAAGSWPRLVRDARLALNGLAQERAVHARPVGRLTAADAAGRRQSLASDSATVLVYWSAGCPYSRALLPKLANLERGVRHLGARLVLVADAAPTADHAALLESSHLAGTVALYDVDRSVAHALSAWAVPKLYVLDRHGVVRFVPEDPNDVLLALTSLDRPEVAPRRLRASAPR